jgi:hypothetical protein
MRRRDFRPAGAIDGFLYAVLQIASYKLDARGTGTTSGQGTCGIFHRREQCVSRLTMATVRPCSSERRVFWTGPHKKTNR